MTIDVTMRSIFRTFYNFEKITESVGKKINFKLATNEKVYALLCVACGWENRVYTVLCWCVGLCVRQFYFINF